MNYFTVVGKFVCYYGEKAINETLVCDGNSDCPVIERFGIGFDESAYICAKDGEHYACEGVTCTFKYYRLKYYKCTYINIGFG